MIWNHTCLWHWQRDCWPEGWVIREAEGQVGVGRKVGAKRNRGRGACKEGGPQVPHKGQGRAWPAEKRARCGSALEAPLLSLLFNTSVQETPDPHNMQQVHFVKKGKHRWRAILRYSTESSVEPTIHRFHKTAQTSTRGPRAYPGHLPGPLSPHWPVCCRRCLVRACRVPPAKPQRSHRNDFSPVATINRWGTAEVTDH